MLSSPDARPSFPPPDFTLHLTELTLAIQGAGVSGSAVTLKTTFKPISPRPETLQSRENYAKANEPGLLGRMIDRRLLGMHKH